MSVDFAGGPLSADRGRHCTRWTLVEGTLSPGRIWLYASVDTHRFLNNLVDGLWWFAKVATGYPDGRDPQPREDGVGWLIDLIRGCFWSGIADLDSRRCELPGGRWPIVRQLTKARGIGSTGIRHSASSSIIRALGRCASRSRRRRTFKTRSTWCRRGSTPCWRRYLRDRALRIGMCNGIRFPGGSFLTS
jgi:hypothetical protein